MSCALPFPRGSTYFGRNGQIVTTGPSQKLEGKVFTVTADDGQHVELMVVRTTVALDFSNVNNRHRGLRFGTGANEIRKRVVGFTNASGQLGVPVDDAYTSAVRANDLIYVVIKGPCRLRAGSATTGAGAAINAQAPVSFGANGFIINSAAGHAPVGVVDQSVAMGATGNNAVRVVHVDFSTANRE